MLWLHLAVAPSRASASRCCRARCTRTELRSSVGVATHGHFAAVIVVVALVLQLHSAVTLSRAGVSLCHRACATCTELPHLLAARGRCRSLLICHVGGVQSPPWSSCGVVARSLFAAVVVVFVALALRFHSGVDAFHAGASLCRRARATLSLNYGTFQSLIAALGRCLSGALMTLVIPLALVGVATHGLSVVVIDVGALVLRLRLTVDPFRAGASRFYCVRAARTEPLLLSCR